MENKINIAELLKNCSQGMELDCSIFEDVTLYKINTDIENEYPIRIKTKNDCFLDLTKYGTYSDVEEAKCVLFPKGKTTWEGFVPPCKFKDGDIVVDDIFPFIYKNCDKTEMVKSYCGIDTKGNFWKASNRWTTLDKITFATEEQKEKLFKAIKDNGYRWNPETRTLEKLIEPKFKIEDIVRCITNIDNKFKIIGIADKYYICENNFRIYFEFQDYWELVPNKFDINTLVPFESKVLVRDTEEEKWKPAIWGYYDANNAEYYPYETVGGNCFCLCIPYEGNEHLLNTTDDCDNFYKT